MRQGHVDEDVIDVERVLRQFQPAIAQKLRAIDDRMHEQVLGLAETLGVLPPELPFRRKHVAITHRGMRAFVNLLVYVVRYDEVGRLGYIDLRTHVIEHLFERIAIEPVIRIHDLEIQPCRVRKAGVDRFAVPSVRLMNRFDDRWMAFLPLVGAHRGVVFGRTVVDDDDFDVIALVDAGHDRLDAGIHVGGRVIARNGE